MSEDTIKKLDQQDPDKVLKKAVEKTIGIVAQYVEPGTRNAEETVEKVIEAVDNEKVKEALEGFDDKRSRAMKIADQEHQDDPHAGKYDEEEGRSSSGLDKGEPHVRRS
jgi:hypothetical protein